MSTQTVDFIESFLAGINFSTFIDSYSNDGTNTTLTVREVFYAREGLNIDVDGTDYVILSVGYDLKEIVVVGVIAAPAVAELQKVQYFHGTPLAVTAELNAISLTSTKAPLLYVYEMIPEDYNHEISNSLDRTASVKMVFLDDSSRYNTTDEHYSSVITPLSNLANKFVDEIIAAKSSFVRVLIDRSRRLNHVYFGTYTDSKGHERKIFNDTFTGIELDIDLPFRKVQSCKVTSPAVCSPATIIDSDGISTFEVASNGTGACTLLEAITVSNSNDTYSVDTLVDLDLPDITHTDSDLSSVILPAQTAMVCTPAVAQSGITYSRPQYNGQDVSYALYDAKWLFDDGHFNYTPPANPVKASDLLDFFNLVNTNAFGNTNRFTDDVGGQTYANDYIIDHYTGLGWYRIQQTSGSWSTNLASADAASFVSFNDWRIPLVSEVVSVTCRDRTALASNKSQAFLYAPFNVVTSGVDTCEISYLTTQRLQIQDGVQVTRTGFTNVRPHILCRNHYT